VDSDILTLAQELAEISRLVDGDDVETTLSRYVRRLVDTVPDCDEAVLVLRNGESFELVAGHQGAGTNQSADPLDAPVAEAGRTVLVDELIRIDGPMRDIVVHGEPHRIADTESDHRWPSLSAAMVTAGYRSCLMLPLVSQNGGTAGFALLSTKPNAFAETTFDLALLFAVHAGVAFDNIQLLHESRSLIEQLHAALETRTVIGQAQGLLMHRYGLDGDLAFSVLRRGSQDKNVKLRNLAAELVQGHNEASLDKVLVEHGLTLSPRPPA
jgi:GAF domain-containing protein